MELPGRTLRRPLTAAALTLVTLTGAAGTAGGWSSPAQAATTATLPAVRATQADALADSYGVVVHPNYGGTPYLDRDAVSASLSSLGVRHVRTAFYNSRSQWSTLRALAADGFRLDLVMGAPGTANPPAKLVRLAADNLPLASIDSFEGANEYNLSGDPQWASHLRAHQQALYTAAKADPRTAGIPVLMPSMGLHKDYEQLGDMRGMADLGNDHLYPGARQPSVKVSGQMGLVRGVVGDKPIVFTETGYHNAMHTSLGHYPASEAAAGVYSPKLLLEYYLRGVQRVYNYELIDQRPDLGKTNQEANFGLLRNDMTPKPAYTALRNLLRLTSDPGPAFTPGTLGYSITGAPADLRQVLVQRRSGTFELMLWRDVSVYDRVREVAQTVAPVNVTVQLAAPSQLQTYLPSTSSAARTQTVASQISLPLAGELTVLEVGAPLAQPASGTGPVAAHYAELGGAQSVLGLPVSAESTIPGGRQRLYEGGAIYWSAATGAREVHGSILSRYRALGGPSGRLGFPTSDQRSDAGGRVSTFRNGNIYWTSTIGAHEVHGLILSRYLALGGPSGLLGYPTTDERVVGAGRVNSFTGGHVYWSTTTGAHEVHGLILSRYAAIGGPTGYAGFPVADEAATAGGRISRFSNADITWSAATGAHAVRGSIRAAWLAYGAAGSRLGLPTGDEYGIPGGRRSDFLGGRITWSSLSGRTTITLG